jgi:hypothetical protein
MANNYSQGSGWVDIPEDKIKQAQDIVSTFEKEYDEDSEWGYLPIDVEVDSNGVWIYGDESVDPDVACDLVERLVKELNLKDPVIMEFSFTCDKPRIDEFGGCGFRVELGKETKWVFTGSLRDL